MNHYKGLVSVLALAVGLAAVSVSQAQTAASALPAKSAEAPMTIVKANSVTSGNLLLFGTPLGQAVLKNTLTGTTTVFQADEDKWAREVFLLDGGKTVGASQSDHTVFWNAATGQKIGRIEARVYGFSHDQKLCFALTPRGDFQFYAYPSLKIVGAIVSYHERGASRFLFSPDDHYLLVETKNSCPESETTYPKPDNENIFHGRTHTFLYDLTIMKDVAKFSHLMVNGMGVFSADSKSIDMNDAFISSYSILEPDAKWQFNITTGTLTKTH